MEKQLVCIPAESPYMDPTNPQTYSPLPESRCDLFTQHPEEFRGTHELKRHNERVHPGVRMFWRCMDNSAENIFEANFKHCCNQEQYSAFYNAAAHLRYAHFNPRTRGGKGGGDDPPMDELMQCWM